MSRTLKIAFWATVIGQIILLLAFIAVKENTLRSGTSVLLQTAPIDPRSVLQGEFAILDYEIAELPDYARPAIQGDSIYVELREGPEGVWVAGQYLERKPDSDVIFIKGIRDRHLFRTRGLGANHREIKGREGSGGCELIWHSGPRRPDRGRLPIRP